MGMKCPNCRGGHPSQDARYLAKCAVIEIIQGMQAGGPQ